VARTTTFPLARVGAYIGYTVPVFVPVTFNFNKKTLTFANILGISRASLSVHNHLNILMINDKKAHEIKGFLIHVPCVRVTPGALLFQ
jgi:hypothetical protein